MAGSDIAMNQFQIVTDADYVYVEKGNSQGKIKKSDLVELLTKTSPFSNIKMAFNTMIFDIEAYEEYVVDEHVCGIFTITNMYRGYPTSVYVLGDKLHAIYVDNSTALSGISLSVDSSRKIHIKSNRNEKSVIVITYQAIMV